MNRDIGWLGSLEEMAQNGGVSKRTIGRWIADGTLKVRRLSAKKIVCRPEDISRAIQKVADRYEMGVK